MIRFSWLQFRAQAAVALGALVAGCRRYAGYPITPASDILHHLASLRNYGVITLQAEDEIAAIGASIGASFAGSLGVTSSSGPGIALKGEAMGLAIKMKMSARTNLMVRSADNPESKRKSKCESRAAR